MPTSPDEVKQVAVEICLDADDSLVAVAVVGYSLDLGALAVFHFDAYADYYCHCCCYYY